MSACLRRTPVRSAAGRLDANDAAVHAVQEHGHPVAGKIFVHRLACPHPVTVVVDDQHATGHQPGGFVPVGVAENKSGTIYSERPGNLQRSARVRNGRLTSIR